MKWSRVLFTGFTLFWLGSLCWSPILAHADVKVDVYDVDVYLLQESLFTSELLEFEGKMELFVTTTAHIITDYGSYTNVRTEIAEMVLYGKNTKSTIYGEELRFYYDAKGHEVLVSGVFKYDIEGKPLKRVEFQYHRGNFVERGLVVDDLFTIEPGSTWSVTFEETVYVNDQRESTIQHKVTVELKNFQTKTVVAGTFDCARLKQLSYEDNEYTGYGYRFVTPVGNETVIIYEENYDEESQLTSTQELRSLALPGVPEGAPLLLFSGLLMMLVRKVRLCRFKPIGNQKKRW